MQFLGWWWVMKYRKLNVQHIGANKCKFELLIADCSILTNYENFTTFSKIRCWTLPHPCQWAWATPPHPPRLVCPSRSSSCRPSLLPVLMLSRLSEIWMTDINHLHGDLSTIILVNGMKYFLDILLRELVSFVSFRWFLHKRPPLLIFCFWWNNVLWLKLSL